MGAGWVGQGADVGRVPEGRGRRAQGAAAPKGQSSGRLIDVVNLLGIYWVVLMLMLSPFILRG